MQKLIGANYPGYYQGFNSRVFDGGRKYFKDHEFPGIPNDQIPNRFFSIPSEVTGESTYCLNDGINVMLTSHVDVSAKGKPYNITLVARQGHKLWRQSLSEQRSRIGRQFLRFTTQ